MNKKVMLYGFIGFVLGVIAVLAFYSFIDEHRVSTTDASEKEPLYWVAPMDESYRRDKPGKSPMGMDLVPVYEEGRNSDEDSPGTVKIHPTIINNLSVKKGKALKYNLIDTINTVGYVNYDENSLIQVHSRTDGWIEKLYVNHNGQYIKAGEPLYTIYSPVLVNAQQEYLLAKKRRNSNLLSAAKQRLISLNFGADQLQEIKQKGTPLQNVTFYAKSDGLVDNLNIRKGEFIKPGTRLMTIGNLDTVWVEVELFERQLPLVKIGKKVQMNLDYLPSKTWSGKVDYIYPMVDSNNRTAKVRLEFTNPEHLLKPNMFADIAIDTESTEKALQVPHNAVIRTEENDRVVLALGDGKFKSVSVNIGRTTKDSIEILDGLIEGDEIVLSGQFLIDSESSIESDFKRFENNTSEEVTNKTPSAKVTGIINSVDVDNHVVNISHSAIQKWGRKPMTMNFNLDHSISIDEFNVGENISFTFESRNNGFFITERHEGMMGHQHD